MNNVARVELPERSVERFFGGELVFKQADLLVQVPVRLLDLRSALLGYLHLVA